MYSTTFLLLSLACTGLCGSVVGDIVSRSTPQNEYTHRPQTEVSPVQLQISFPLAAEQLLQLASSASPDVWRDILAQTPDAARRALLAQLRARRQTTESRDRDLHQSAESRDRDLRGPDGASGHDLHRTGGDLTSRRSFSESDVDLTTRRSYSTLERDGRGRRRVASRQQQPSFRYQTQTGRPSSRTTNNASWPSRGSQPPPREYERTTSSHRPPPSHFDYPTSSHRPPVNVFDGPSSSYKSSPVSSRVSVSRHRYGSFSSSWDKSTPSSRPQPPTNQHDSPPPRYETTLPSYHTSPRSHSGPPRGGPPRVTTYRPRRAETTTYRQGRADVTTYRPARRQVGVPSVRYSPPDRPTAPGYIPEERTTPAASGYSPEDEDDHQHQAGLDWLRDVVPGVPGQDYPILGSIPVTSFSCAGRPEGYFSDVSARCQVYHVCHGAFQMSSFICPNGTVFSQSLATCDWWFNTECSADQPLPSSTFRVSRQASGFMFEDDWVDDYEDYDVTEVRPSVRTQSRPRATYREKKTLRRRPSTRSGVGHRGPEDDYSAPGGGAPSASSRDRHSASVRSSYSVVPASVITERYRRPERHLAERLPPPGERNVNLPTADREKGRYTTRRTKTFVTTLRTPASRDKRQNSARSKPFTIRVSYGGKSGRTTKELKFGPEAAQSFLSRAQLRRWSFSGGDAIESRVGVSERTDDTEKQRGSTPRGARVLEKARDKAFDFEIGRRHGHDQDLLGSESRPQSLHVLLRDAVRPSPELSRTTFVHPPPTRPMARPAADAEVAPPETSVEPPTVADTDPAAGRLVQRGLALVQGDYDQSNPFGSERSTVRALTQESQREQSPSDGRRGDSRNLSFIQLTTEGSDSSNGGNVIVTDDAVDFDYDDLLDDESFKRFGLKIFRDPAESKNQQSPG